MHPLKNGLAQTATKRCMMVSFVTDHKSESQLVEYHDNSSSNIEQPLIGTS